MFPTTVDILGDVYVAYNACLLHIIALPTTGAGLPRPVYLHNLTPIHLADWVRENFRSKLGKSNLFFREFEIGIKSQPASQSRKVLIQWDINLGA